MPLRLALALIIGLLAPPAAVADTVTTQNGSDTFIAGDTVLTTLDEKGDAFVAASTAILGGVVADSLNVAGFDISVGTETGGDLYAMGFTVEIDAGVAGDLSAMGFTVTTTEAAETEGNTRLAGNTVRISGPVSGALTVMGRSVVLDAEVDGDVRITAASLTFGENAVVRGRLHYSTEDEVAVPERVASADRVVYSRLEVGEGWRDMRENWPAPEMPGFPTAMTMFGAFIVSLLFFLILGAIALAFFPDQLERTRASLAAAPGRTMLAGVAGLALLFGLLPVAAMTIAGIPFIPVIILALVVAWTFGYALGAYALAVYVWSRLKPEDVPGTAVRLALLAAAITVVALFNFIPFVGWVVNFTVVLLGIGAMSRPLLARIAARPAAEDAPAT